MVTSTLRDILSRKYISIAIVIVCVLARVIQLVFFYNIRVDASYQVLATQHLVEGHGVSFAEVFANDLSKTNYQLLINWPPGYSLLLAPFYILFDQNYIAAGITLDILAAILLILSCRAILKVLDVPLHKRNIFTLLTCFFIYSFYFIASSDAVAIALFAAALHLGFSAIVHRKNYLRNLLLSAFLLLLTAWIKYLFIPLAFIPILFWLVRGMADKDRQLRNSCITSLILLLSGVGALMIFQQTETGSVGYISQSERGWFPEHLAEFYPFLPAAFLKPDTIETVFNIRTQLILPFYRIIHLIALTAAIVWAIRQLRMYGFSTSIRKIDFGLLGLILSLAIIVLLATLSIRVAKEEIVPGTFWTYVEETRYYGLAYVLIHLFFFLNSHRNRVAKYLGIVLFGLLSVEAARGLVLVSKRVFLFGKETYSWQYEDEFQKYSDRIISEAKQKSGINRVVVTGSSYYMNHRTALYSHVPILYESEKLNDPNALATSEPCILLVTIHRDARNQFEPFLSRQGVSLAGEWDGFYFYTLYVYP